MNRRFSLRTELLLSLAVLALAALAIAVASVVWLYGVFAPDRAAVWVSVLVAADLLVLLGFVAYQVERVVLRPIRDATAATEAISGGDLQRRLPPGDSVEMANLAESVNRMTDRLLEERAALVRSEKMASIGRLAAGVAHEIGNPLGAINGYAHILGTKVAVNEEARDAVAGLEREAGRIDRIVRGLLDYARARPRAQGHVDLNEAARNVVELLSTQGILKHVQLELHPDRDPALVAGDRHDLEQMLVNLLLNAVDAMGGVSGGSLSIILRRTTRAELLAGSRRSSDSGAQPLNPPGPRAMRWLESAPTDQYVMVAVADSGPGIPAEDAERVFEPFYTTKEPGKGTGLGLAIVARAVENSQGTIWVSPSREGGAAFRILFPLVEGAPTSRKSRPSGAVRRT